MHNQATAKIITSSNVVVISFLIVILNLHSFQILKFQFSRMKKQLLS